jgi:hypothetical protein
MWVTADLKVCSRKKQKRKHILIAHNRLSCHIWGLVGKICYIILDLRTAYMYPSSWYYHQGRGGSTPQSGCHRAGPTRHWPATRRVVGWVRAQLSHFWTRPALTRLRPGLGLGSYFNFWVDPADPVMALYLYFFYFFCIYIHIRIILIYYIWVNHSISDITWVTRVLNFSFFNLPCNCATQKGHWPVPQHWRQPIPNRNLK